jgi:adenosylmethionine-8-amino-7-oxononanoate aminotransferase
LFFDVDFIPFPTVENEEQILQQAEKLFETGEFACLIVEPLVQGSAGMRMYRPEFLDRLSNCAKKHEVLVIFDEIMTGWGRTGKLFAMDYCTTKPDMVCLSKGLTAGVLPLGLTVATQAVYDAFLAPEKTKALLHGHSYTGNALACAVACANIELVNQPSFAEGIQRISAQHALFKNRIENQEKLLTVRQQGTIIALEIKQEVGSSYFSSLRDVAYDYFLEKGLLIRPLGNVIFLNPPYCTTDEELEKMYAGIESFLTFLSEN